MVKSSKVIKEYRILIAPDYVKSGDEATGLAIAKTFEKETVTVVGTDTFIQSGGDFDFFCVRAADGSTAFTVPAYKVRYCRENQKKKSKVLAPISVIKTN